MAFTLSSQALHEGGEIPRRYTCKGADVSLLLALSGVRDSAKDLVLIVGEPDAPDPAAPRMTWVHWVLYNILATAPGFQEGVTAGALEGTNDFHRTS